MRDPCVPGRPRNGSSRRRVPGGVAGTVRKPSGCASACGRVATKGWDLSVKIDRHYIVNLCVNIGDVVLND